MDHSPEPWKIGSHTSGSYIVAADKSAVELGITIGGKNADENRKRIVICVNACKGFDNEMLERCASGTPDPVTAGENWFQLYAEAVKRIAELTCELAKK